MPYKALCVLLKLSLLLDNGEAHSPSHFTAFKVVFKLHFSYLSVSYNFFKMSSPTTCRGSVTNKDQKSRQNFYASIQCVYSVVPEYTNK